MNGPKDHLKKHRKAVHEGIKDFKCDKCDKAFASITTLKTHITYVHTNKRDHICEDCGKAFATKSAVNRHFLTVHKGVKRSRPSKVKNDISASAFHRIEFM